MFFVLIFKNFQITANAGTEQTALIAAIQKATTDLAANLASAAKDATDCLIARSGEAVEGASYIGDDLKTCLAGTA